MSEQWGPPGPPPYQPPSPTQPIYPSAAESTLQWPASAPAPYPGQGYQQPAPVYHQPYYPQAAPMPYGAAAIAVRSPTDQRTNAVEVIIAWILTVVTLGYFLPWAIAATRGKSNSGAIGIINFLLGWTLVGWIVALVMACGAHQTTAVNVAVAQSAVFGGYPPPGYPAPGSYPPGYGQPPPGYGQPPPGTYPSLPQQPTWNG